MADRDSPRSEQQPPTPPPAETLAQAQVIAGALAAAVVVYAVVAWVVVEVLGGEVLAGGLAAPLPGVLVAAAAAVLLAAPVVERRIMAQPRPGTAEEADAASTSRTAGAAGTRVSFVERYRLAKLVGFALRETAAVIGLVVGLTTGEPRWTWGISAGTLLLMALAWPRAADLPPASGSGRAAAVEPQ